MLRRGVETVESIIGNDPFGLIEKDARFARYDARKILRGYGSESHWIPRVANLFEGLSNDDLLEHMRQLYVSIADYEATGLPRDQLLQRLMTNDPDVYDYDLLFRKASWGNRLSDALCPERFQQDQDGNLWSDFVMGRINRALAGEMTR